MTKKVTFAYFAAVASDLGGKELFAPRALGA